MDRDWSSSALTADSDSGVRSVDDDLSLAMSLTMESRYTTAIVLSRRGETQGARAGGCLAHLWMH